MRGSWLLPTQPAPAPFGSHRHPSPRPSRNPLIRCRSARNSPDHREVSPNEDRFELATLRLRGRRVLRRRRDRVAHRCALFGSHRRRGDQRPVWWRRSRPLFRCALRARLSNPRLAPTILAMDLDLARRTLRYLRRRRAAGQPPRLRQTTRRRGPPPLAGHPAQKRIVSRTGTKAQPHRKLRTQPGHRRDLLVGGDLSHRRARGGKQSHPAEDHRPRTSRGPPAHPPSLQRCLAPRHRLGLRAPLPVSRWHHQAHPPRSPGHAQARRSDRIHGRPDRHQQHPTGGRRAPLQRGKVSRPDRSIARCHLYPQ